MKRMCWMPILLITAVLAASSAQAGPGPENMDANAIRAQQAQIRADVEARSGRYAAFDEAKRQQLWEKQAVVNRLLEGKASMLELGEIDRIAVFNALESISALINGDESTRTVCRRHKPVGSNRPVTVCKTVAELEAEKRAADHDHGRRNLQCSTATMGPGGCPGS